MRQRRTEREIAVRSAKRIFAVGAAFACSFGLLASRAVSFHLKDNGEIERVAMRQYRTAVHQSTRRGRILDRVGRELAMDTAVESLYADPREISDPVAVAEGLSRSLKLDRLRLLEKLTAARKFVWIKRRVSPDEAAWVASQGFKGVYSMKESGRSYPGGQLAAALLGAVGFDAEPLGGVELSYDKMLTAKGGASDVRRDARGHLYLSPAAGWDEPALADIWLTIDQTLQHIVERELGEAVAKAKGRGGSAVVVDVATGAILAMANVPVFDPNSYERYSLSSWRNRAIADAYEPGSTFKTIVVAAALDAGLVAPADVFDCENGRIKIGSDVVRDAHPRGRLTVADIIKVSSNIGAYKVEQRLGPARAYDAIRAFGFGRPTGIDLPGESPGLLMRSNRWSELQFATIAFGQGIAVTPLQMAMAFAAIANGGTLLEPHIVGRITGEGGAVLMLAEPLAVGHPIGPQAAGVMAELLERVTEKGGTGVMARSREYRVAGKTGTAQKANLSLGGYAKGKYYSSFVGFAPVEAPRIAVFVGVDEPAGMYYGGQIAAPAFREIVEASLHYLKVPGRPVEASLDREHMDAPRAAIAELPQPVLEGDGSWRLPDLRGLTMRGVLEAAGEADVAWRFKGSGIAVSQSPGPGGAVPPGGDCEVEFRPLM